MVKRALRVIVSAVFILVGVVLFSLGQPSEHGGSVIVGLAFLACGCAAFAFALPRHAGIALLVAAVTALTYGEDPLENLTVFTVAFVLLFSAGVVLLVGRHRKYSKYTLLLLSLPWWGLGDVGEWTTYVALGLVYLWLLVRFYELFVSARHLPYVEPDPRLAHGPLTEVPARTFDLSRGRRVVLALAVVATAACAAGGALWVTVNPQAGAGTVAIGASLAAPLWLTYIANGRMRFRVDSAGVHARVIGETTIRWSEIGHLSASRVLLSAIPVAASDQFYIRGKNRQIVFSGAMPGAGDLAGIVAAATGMSWSEGGRRAHTAAA